MKYRVVIYYKTKRERVALGMTIEALDEDAAEELAKAKTFKGYPSRKWVATEISEERP